MFENIRQDFKANGSRLGAQGFWALSVYRFGRWRNGVRPALLRKLFSFVYRFLFKLVQILAGIELPCETQVGRSLTIDHFGGIIISGFAKIGNNCRIRNGVTVGIRRMGEWEAPTIGDNVDIGAGAKILGPVSIGNGVVIGANAVVLCDVPDFCSAVGIPATVKARRKLKAPLADVAVQSGGCKEAPAARIEP
jgi:serine O-acetyltransferase